MNEEPKVALVSEGLLAELIALLPMDVQARVVVHRNKNGELVTSLWVDGCKCCEGPR